MRTPPLALTLPPMIASTSGEVGPMVAYSTASEVRPRVAYDTAFEVRPRVFVVVLIIKQYFLFCHIDQILLAGTHTIVQFIY